MRVARRVLFAGLCVVLGAAVAGVRAAAVAVLSGDAEAELFVSTWC